MHLHHSESCNSFFLRHYVSNDCTTNRKNSLFSNDWENHIEFTSSLPKKALQRQFVNVVDPSLFCSNLLPLAQDDDMETSLQFETNSEASSEAAISNTSFPPACVHNHCPPQFLYTRDQKWTVALLKLLDDIQAPDYAFGLILKWAQQASSEGYTFNPEAGGLSHTDVIDNLFSSVLNAERLLPSVRSIPCPNGGSPSEIICFDFVPQLLMLMQNPRIMIPDNLLLDEKNPLEKFCCPSGCLCDAISGSVYSTAYDRMISHPSKQLFVPIIQWIDGTAVTGNDRFELKPHMFTLAIFKEEFRRKIDAWGYHGFIPKPKASSAENSTRKQGDNIRRYHAELSGEMESMSNNDQRLKNVLLPIGPTGFMKVEIVVCLLFVIQDIEEGDRLCARFKPHTPGVQRQCRACNVSYEDLDDPYIECLPLYADTMHQIAISGNLDVQRRWSQHAVQNAFLNVPMADPKFGIFGSTPVETMHVFQKGMIEVVTFLVLENVPDSKKAQLDALAVKFHETHRQTIRKIYPSTDFSKGVTNLTKISAGERVGLVFLFVILANYDQGWEILNAALQSRTTTKLSSVLELFEAMICFDAWLKKQSIGPGMRKRILWKQ